MQYTDYTDWNQQNHLIISLVFLSLSAITVNAQKLAIVSTQTASYPTTEITFALIQENQDLNASE